MVAALYSAETLRRFGAHFHRLQQHLLFLCLRFMQDLEDMLGFRPYNFYYYMWRYVSPAVLVVLIIATVIEMAISPAGYNAWVESEVSHLYFSFSFLEEKWLNKS